MPKHRVPLNKEVLQARISYIEDSLRSPPPASYKDIPRLLEKYKIIPSDFASNQLSKMAGYRNRMVHFYGEISENEIYKIIQEELQDFYAFCVYIEKILRDPSKYDLSVE